MNNKPFDKSGRLEVFDAAEQANRIVKDAMIKKTQSEKEMNKFIYIFGIVAPCLVLFRAWKIFYLGNAISVSGITWSVYLTAAAMWFGYGIYYKNKAIMLVY